MEEKQNLYNKLVNQPREKLEQIVEDAADFETKYLDRQDEFISALKENNECTKKYEALLTENTQPSTSKHRKKEIKQEVALLEAKMKQLIENTSRLENDLNKVKDKRKQFALARDIIENYILQGKTLSESEGAVHVVASSSKEVSEKQQPATENDELNQYLGDIYKMYENHQTDDEMYKAMQAYTTIGLEKIQSTNKRHMREYEHHLNEKARMDIIVGRKPKNYHSVAGKVQYCIKMNIHL